MDIVDAAFRVKCHRQAARGVPGDALAGLAGCVDIRFAEEAAVVFADEERAVGPVADEVAVEPAALDHDVSDRERQRRVGPGPHAEPLVGAVGEPDSSGIDDDEPRPAFERGDGGSGVDDPSQRRVVAPEQDASGPLKVRHERAWHRRAEGIGSGEVAAPAAELHGDDVVGAAIGATETHDPVERIRDRRGRGRGGGEDHRLWTVLGGDAAEVRGDRVEGLVPPDLDPAGIGLALRSSPLQRTEEALRVVDDLRRDLALEAERLAGRMFGVGVEGDEPPVGDGGNRTAPRDTKRAEAGDALAVVIGHWPAH